MGFVAPDWLLTVRKIAVPRDLMAMAKKSDKSAPSLAAISRWENEGGSSRSGSTHFGDSVETPPRHQKKKATTTGAAALTRKGVFKRKHAVRSK